MVKFRMESGCMAMQLVLCLLLGLRLVSASLLQQSKAGSLFQLPFSHRPPPPASREWRLADQPPAKAKHRGHRSAKKDSAAGAGVIKRSLRGENVVCEKGNRKRDVDLAAACGSNVAGDFGHANAVKESMVNSPESVPPINDYDVGSSYTQSEYTGGGGDGYNRAWSNRKAPHPAPYSGPDAAPSSSSSSSDAAAPPIASLPDTDPGVPTDPTPNTNTNTSPDPNQDPTPSSNSTAPAPSTQPSSVPAPNTRQRTVAIAAGVTVPVVALGLVALLLLHKQRRRRKEMQQARLLGGGDEEAHTPATLLDTPQLLVKEMPHELEGTPLAEHEADPTPHPDVVVNVLDSHASHKVVQEEEDAALARPEEASETSHSSVSAGALSPSTSSSSGRLGRSASGPMHKSAGSGVTRNRSLKRKPVPALIETDEPEKTNTRPPETAPAPASEQPPTLS